jgi:hypothetical protein
MLSIIWKTKGLICRDLYFYDELPQFTTGEDIQHVIQASKPFSHCESFVTSIIDLRISEKNLFNAITDGFSYQIRRANDRDGASVAILDSPNNRNIEEFISFYNQFARTKSLASANKEKLEQLAANSALTLSIAGSKETAEKWLSAHAYVCDGKRARLLYSARNHLLSTTKDKNLAGRINKYMHWRILIYFKSKKYEAFDFGGISSLGKLKSLNDFKEAFGGKRVVEYNGVRGITTKGKAVAIIFRIQSKLRSHSK